MILKLFLSWWCGRRGGVGHEALIVEIGENWEQQRDKQCSSSVNVDSSVYLKLGIGGNKRGKVYVNHWLGSGARLKWL